MSWDHRAFDGAYAAAFLVRVKEHPRDPRLGRPSSGRVAAAGPLARARSRTGEAYALQRALVRARPRRPPAAARAPARLHARRARRPRPHVLVRPASVGAELVRADRGGDVTYHGPGQLVGYPILSLPGKPAWRRHGRHRGLRPLGRAGADRRARRPRAARRAADSAGTRACGSIPTARPRKIAAIGVQAEPRPHMHGFALNVDPDLAMFGHIVPCGIARQARDVAGRRRHRRRRCARSSTPSPGAPPTRGATAVLRAPGRRVAAPARRPVGLQPRCRAGRAGPARVAAGAPPA